MKLFINRGPDNGCTYYRQTLPLRHCMPWLRELGVRVTYSKTLNEGHEHDAYVFSRWIDAAYLPVICALKRRGKVIIWDLDDDLLLLSRHKPEHQAEMALRIRNLQLCLELADLITVSTEHLATRTGWPEKTLVCPNLIDLKDNPVVDQGERRGILFTGSPSHLWDLDLVRDLYHQTKREHPWYFYGTMPKWLDHYGTYVPWSRVHEYPRVCRLLRPLWSVCPLEDCEFNLSKSAIKVWETASLGSNVCASNVGPYLDHPCAHVPPGEAFTLDHLDQARGNWRKGQAIAVQNSWQWSQTGKSLWEDYFSYVYDFTHRQRSQHAA